jgi:ribosomal protein S18 acetylase RimI-like enzyme
MTLEVRAAPSRAAWADRLWLADRDGTRVAHLLLDSVGGTFELWLTDEPDREAGAALLGCLDGHAGPLESIVPDHMTVVGELLEAAGFAVEREVWQLARPLAGDEPPPAWPEGVAVRTYDDAADSHAVHALLELAFATSHERVEPYERWHRWMTGDAEFDAGCWWLAERDGHLVGVALCWTTGWLKDLAVHPDERGRGLGEALCRQVFREFSRRGVEQVGLKVDADNPTGAVRLYQRMGMRTERVYRMWVRG